jgi:hypothetical protein
MFLDICIYVYMCICIEIAHLVTDFYRRGEQVAVMMHALHARLSLHICRTQVFHGVAQAKARPCATSVLVADKAVLPKAELTAPAARHARPAFAQTSAGKTGSAGTPSCGGCKVGSKPTHVQHAVLARAEQEPCDGATAGKAHTSSGAEGQCMDSQRADAAATAAPASSAPHQCAASPRRSLAGSERASNMARTGSLHTSRRMSCDVLFEEGGKARVAAEAAEAKPAAGGSESGAEADAWAAGLRSTRCQVLVAWLAPLLRLLVCAPAFKRLWSVYACRLPQVGS